MTIKEVVCASAIVVSSLACTTDLEITENHTCLNAGVNGLNDTSLRMVLGEICDEIKKRESPYCPAVVIEHVGFGYDNIHEVRQAHEKEIPINLLYFSSGANNAESFMRQCEQEEIEIERAVFLDPTCTSFGKIEIPPNVKQVYVFTSTKEDWLSVLAGEWIRGDPETFDRDPRVESHSIETNHLNLPRNLKLTLREMIDQPEYLARARAQKETILARKGP